MSSNAKRGAYFKGKTRAWLRDRGWQVADLEVIRWVFRPGAERMPVKRDQLGSDLLAVGDAAVVFVQVKGGQQAIGGGTFPAARRAFAEYVWPPCSERWIVAWAPRARSPRVLKVDDTGGLLKEDAHGEESSDSAPQVPRLPFRPRRARTVTSEARPA